MTGDQPMWRKSSYSGSTGCVEVAPLPYGARIRDSKNTDRGELRVPGAVWRSFVRKITTS